MTNDIKDEIGCALFNLTAYAISKGLTEIAASLESVAANHGLVPKMPRDNPAMKLVHSVP